MLSGKICLQHKILGFAIGTNVNTENDKSMEPMSDSFFHVHISLAFVTTRMLPEMTKETWCQNPIHPAWQPNAAIWMRVPQDIQCTALLCIDFHLSGPLKKHLGGHMFQDAMEVQEVISQWFHSLSPEFYTEGINSLMTHCSKCMNLHGKHMEN
jgi:hypothetical protein